MGAEVKSKRFIESWLGKLALLLLAAVWIFSMSGVDKNAYSAFPVTVAVGVVALLIVAGVCLGYKLVRISWLGWFSLIGAGGYFMARCCMSYSVVEAWREGALILGAMVFYLMGLYAAQLRSNGWLYGVLLLAVALNILYSYLMNDTDAPMLLTGRPDIGLTGPNTRPSTLFLYCNIGAAFLMLGGALLLNIALWRKRLRVVYALCGIVSVVLSFYYEARVVFLLAPLLLVLTWFAQFLSRLFEKQPLGWKWFVSGVMVIVAVGILVSELIWGYELMSHALKIETHGRYYMWKTVLKTVFDDPAWGCGASAVQWEVLPIYVSVTQTPNYAHNEYIQAWVDYGIIGLLLMVLVLVFHVGYGIWSMSSEYLTGFRRKKILIALVIVVALAACSYTDYFLHFYSMSSLTAFCCGLLASPVERDRMYFPWQRKWAESDSRNIVPISAQGKLGSAVLVIFCVGVLTQSAWLSEKLYRPWVAQWEFFALCSPGRDDDATQRHLIQEKILDSYPDAGIMDYFYSIPLSGISWQRQEAALKKVLAANPKNLYVVTMLGNVLCHEKKHEEAEALYRKYYTVCSLKGALPVRGPRQWHSYYAYNLLRWGYQKMKLGDTSTAYSMMDYALNIHAKHRIHFNYRYGIHSKGWDNRDAVHPDAPAFIRMCAKNVELFKILGVRKDDSWKEPLEAGGSAALYQEWGHAPRRIPSKKKKRKSAKK